MSEEEQRGVLRKYDKRGTGMVNYREFCATVDNGVWVLLPSLPYIAGNVCICKHSLYRNETFYMEIKPMYILS